MIGIMAYIVLDEETMKAYRCYSSQELTEIILKLETTRREGSLFRALVLHPEPERLLQRLHELIDGRCGAAVGSVLFKCTQEGWLSRKPTQTEFCSEFTLRGTWSAIHNYMDEHNGNAWAKAERVVIF